MEQLYLFLIVWDIPIYFVAGLVLFVSLFQYGQANRQLRRAVFSLERERALTARTNAGMFVVGATAVIALITYVNFAIAPTLPPELLKPPTPTPNIFSTPFASPTPLGEGELLTTPRPRVTPDLVPTVTLPAGALPTAVSPLVQATAPPAAVPPSGGVIPQGGGCTPGVNISAPGANTAVFGTVTFSGSATGADFLLYRLELQGETTGGAWVSLVDDGYTAVDNGILGSANLSNLPNGEYDVRLSVLGPNNQSAQLVEQCTNNSVGVEQ
jgi:hypothetical protein